VEMWQEEPAVYETWRFLACPFPGSEVPCRMVNTVICPLRPSDAFLSAFVDRGEHTASSAARAAVLAAALTPPALFRGEREGVSERRTTVSLDAPTHQLLGHVFLSHSLSSLTDLCSEVSVSTEGRALTLTLLEMPGEEREKLLLDTLRVLGHSPVQGGRLTERRAARMTEALRRAEGVFSPEAVIPLRQELDALRGLLSGK